MDWNDMALMLRRAADEINKKREAERRSDQRARFKATPQGKIAAYRRFVREYKKALRGETRWKSGWQTRADKVLEDMDPETRERLSLLDRRRARRDMAHANEVCSSTEWGSAA
jgi:hypothetical protein